MASPTKEEKIKSSDEEGSEEEEEEGEESWIDWFCNLAGNEMFCRIDPGFFEDNFNLFGLNKTDNYDIAIATILDKEGGDVESDEISRAAQVLYGLVHAVKHP